MEIITYTLQIEIEEVIKGIRTLQYEDAESPSELIAYEVINSPQTFLL